MRKSEEKKSRTKEKGERENERREKEKDIKTEVGKDMENNWKV